MSTRIPIGSDLHFGHHVLYFEDEKTKERSYRLTDADGTFVADFYPTVDGDGKKVPADIAEAMKLAKRRDTAAKAEAALDALQDIEERADA